MNDNFEENHKPSFSKKADHHCPRRHQPGAVKPHVVGYIALGLASLLWLLFRSGPKPRRLAYPCQQAALATTVSFVAYLAAVSGVTFLYRHLRQQITVNRLLLFILGLSLTLFIQAEITAPAQVIWASPNLPAWSHPEAISDLFAVNNVPVPTASLDGGTIPAGLSPAEALSDTGVEALINLMATHDTYFYQTAAHPQGLIGPNDVVILKVNNQWNAARSNLYQRGHTNIDVVKGLIWRIEQHPAGFTGAVIVADNGQDFAVFDNAAYNNAEDPRQSYQDTVDAFVSQGYDVCISDWDDLRANFVAEYDMGDMADGYVLIQDDSPGVDQLSYPKFGITCGRQSLHLSLRYGLWQAGAYDNDRLKLINLPVLKGHGLAGATISVKNFMGFVSLADIGRRYGTIQQMHESYMLRDYGMLGRQLALIRRADLNLVDGIWVAPSQSGNNASRDDVLLAGIDPFAVDYYASAHVLTPHFTPGTDAANNADARHQGGDFRTLLLTNENIARRKGLTDVINLDDDFTVVQEEAQFNVFVADASQPLPITLDLTAQPARQTIQPGESSTYQLSIHSYGGATGPVTLTAAPLPPEVNVSFTSNPVTPPALSTLTVTTTPSVTPGLQTLAISGASPIATATTIVELMIAQPATDFDLTISPTLCMVEVGEPAIYTVTVSSLNSNILEPVELAIAGLPPSLTPIWSHNPVWLDSIATLALAGTEQLNVGHYPFSITAISNTQMAEANVALFITGKYQIYLPLISK